MPAFTVTVTDDPAGPAGLLDGPPVVRGVPLLGEADLKSEYKRRLSFHVEHERRLTFKRERAQSDASHKRGPPPPLPVPLSFPCPLSPP
jgi:hypothetical protein